MSSGKGHSPYPRDLSLSVMRKHRLSHMGASPSVLTNRDRLEIHPRLRSPRSWRSHSFNCRPLCFGKRPKVPGRGCGQQCGPSASRSAVKRGAGSSRTLHTFSTLIVHVCTVAGSSLSLQLPERVAQSAFLAPTTKCRRRAAAVPKCVVKNHFDSNNNG